MAVDVERPTTLRSMAVEVERLTTAYREVWKYLNLGVNIGVEVPVPRFVLVNLLRLIGEDCDGKQGLTLATRRVQNILNDTCIDEPQVVLNEDDLRQFTRQVEARIIHMSGDCPSTNISLLDALKILRGEITVSDIERHRVSLRSAVLREAEIMKKAADDAIVFELTMEEERRKYFDAEQVISYLENRLESTKHLLEEETVHAEDLQQQLFSLETDAELMTSYLEEKLLEERTRNDRLSGQRLEGLSLQELVVLQHELMQTQQRVSLQLTQAAEQSTVRWQFQADDGTFHDFDREANQQIERHARGGVVSQSLQVNNQGKRISIDVESLEQEVQGGSGKRRRIRRADEILLREPSWVQQAREVELVPVEPGTSDYVKVLNAAFGEWSGSLRGSFELKSLQRIQNTFLWRKFEAERQNLIAVRGASGVSEKALFHGTRAHSPFEIVLKKEGFMLDHARDGLYGKGLYFANLPHYSHTYAHRTCGTSGDCEYHMLMCRVLCGKSRRMGTATDRTMSRLKLPPAEYDSVEGGPHHPRHAGPGPGCSLMYVIYQDTQVYPEFIFTYQMANASKPWSPEVPAVAA